MGILFSVFTAIFLSVSSALVPFAEIQKEFEANNSEKIVALCTEKIFININGEQNIYSKSQAKLILKGYFKKNPCKTFQYIFKGEDANYPTAIAKITTQEGSYTLNLKFKKVGGRFLVESIGASWHISANSTESAR